MGRRFGPEVDDNGLLRISPGDTFTDAPYIARFSPAEAGVGDWITIRGFQLQGASIFVGDVPARVRMGEATEVTAQVPRLEREQYAISAYNEFGHHVSGNALYIVSTSNRYTYRGDADGWKAADGHSIVPSAKDQPVLVLVCQAPDSGIPSGTTANALLQHVHQMLDGATDSVNAFWKEATYGKTSFKYTIPNQVFTLPNDLVHYFQASRARRIDGSGVTYPIEWKGGETLTLVGDDGAVSVTFTKGKQGVGEVATTINNEIGNASLNPNSPPFVADENGGQLYLQTTAQSAQAVLRVTGGTARATLGLDAAHATVVSGLDGVANRKGFLRHGLDQFLKGKTNAQARAKLDQYACVICALAHDTTSHLMRAYANSVRTYDYAGGGQAHFSDVVITTGYPWTTWAHEIGHTLGLPDLYDESGKQVGIEPDLLDIMGPRHYGIEAHPLAWAKHWRSRRDADASGNGYTLKPWMDDGNVTTITTPLAGTTKTWEFILAPTETPLPTVNPFAATYPNAPLKHAVRIETAPEYAIYLENRQLPFTSSQFGTSRFDSDLPATGVFVSSAVDRDNIKLFRVFCVLETPGNNPLDTKDEEWSYYVTATNRIRVRLLEILGASPPCYRVQVQWAELPPATGTKMDLRITDWSPPPWESPDIWVDTEVDNDWDVYRHSDAKENPKVPGHPVRSGDRLKARENARLYARVWNDGTYDKKGAVVHFKMIRPAGMGPSKGAHIGTAPPVDVPAGSFAVAGPVVWAPMDDEDKHICVRAFVTADPAEKEHANNTANENFADWYVEASSPYELLELPFQVTNPLARRALVQMRANGLEPGFNLTVEPYEFWLEPGETRPGCAVLETEAHVALEDLRLEEGKTPPVISVEAWVLRRCTFVPFGGISGEVHTVRRSRLDMAIDPTGDGYDVTGTATNAGGPIAGQQVSVRLLEVDGFTVRARERTQTSAQGHYHVHLSRGRVAVRPAEPWLLIDAALSPAPGIGPAEAGPVRVT